jgi:hypothetical protein
VPGKFSELILEFAEPLLDQGARSDPQVLRAVLVVAVLCWNAGALEIAGDPNYRDIVATLLAMVPVEDRALLEQLIATRKTRYRAIPFLLDVEVTENPQQHARVEARAYLTQRPSASSTRPKNGGWSSTPLAPSAPGGMTPFDTVFRDVASEETRSWMVVDERSLPRGSYLLRELYCTELDCDCRRVLVQVHHVETRTIAATINYAFEPPSDPRFPDERQLELDPLNPQGPHARELLEMFTETVSTDRAYHDRLVRHYTMWKRAVDDEAHPAHAKVRSTTHDDPKHAAAFPRQELSQRHGMKVPVNAPCPCGSGRKYKKCCRA